MVRQAHTYLVGAMGGATLIAIAIAFFVVLVSAQVFKDWPIAALGGDSGGTAAVSESHPASGSAGTAATVTASAGAAHGHRGGGKSGGGNAPGDGAAAQPAAIGTAGGTDSSEGGGGGSGGGSGSETPSSQPSPSSPASTGTSGNGSSGGGSGGGSAGSGTAASSPSAKVTETVNGAVTKVDETATGGALGGSGVTEATEGVVNGVAGPESVVGNVVDETVGAVEGLLHGNH